MKKAITILILIAILTTIFGCGQSPIEQNSKMVPSKQAATFKSKDELISAIENPVNIDISTDTSYKELTYFFEPKWLPKDAQVYTVDVREGYVAFTYALGDPEKIDINDFDKILIFEWYRLEGSDGPKNYFERHKKDYKHLKNNKDYYIYVVKNPVPNETGIFDPKGPVEAVCYNVFWTQDGYSFHAVLPLSYSEDDIQKFCRAQIIKLKEKSDVK